MLLTGCGNDPAAAEDSAMRAEQLFQAKQLDAALAAIDKAIGKQDDVIQYHILKGRIEFARNSKEGAFAAYSDCLDLDSSNNECLQAVSQLGLQTGHFTEAVEAADRILVLQPGDPNAMLIKGLSEMVRGRTQEGEKIADQILKANPGFEGGIILKARALFREDKWNEALATLDSGIASNGKTLGILLSKLDLYRSMGDRDAALRTFDELRTIKPLEPRQAMDEAYIRYKAGQTVQARALLRGLLDGNVTDRVMLAKIVALWQEYDPTPLSPQDISALSAKGTEQVRTAAARFLLEHGNLAGADTLIASATSNEAKGLRARIIAAKGQGQPALAAARAVLEDDKQQCDALLVTGNPKLVPPRDAIVASQQVVAECPGLAAGPIALAAAYQAVDDPDGEVRAFRDGVAKTRQNTPLTARFAQRLTEMGRNGQAVTVVRMLNRDAQAKVSGWQLLVQTCERTGDSDCVRDAQAGLTRAQGLLWPDLEPGERLPNGLFGRLSR